MFFLSLLFILLGSFTGSPAIVGKLSLSWRKEVLGKPTKPKDIKLFSIILILWIGSAV